jgi:serine O-acetyltransferase
MLNPLSLHRIAHGLHNSQVSDVLRMMDYQLRILLACWLPRTARIGRHAVLVYGGLGIVIHREAQIGNNVHIDQGVTIGGNVTARDVPTIGHGVYLGARAKILIPVIIWRRDSD